jgi:tryptophan synthase alpha chain
VSRIETRFAELKQRGRRALIPFITAGDPSVEDTLKLMHQLVDAGADLIELGVPFSDPMADGPVIQRASERALARGVGPAQVFEIVTRFRATDAQTPVVLMGYLNPVERWGYEAFVGDAAKAGVDALLIVDMPPVEASDFNRVLKNHGLDTIFLLAPTSTPERMRAICDAASGFVYYVALKGVTGSADLQTDEVAARLAEVRQLTELPLGVGFGISDATSAAAMAKVADAVIVGSALMQRIEAAGDDVNAGFEAVTTLVREMRQAIDAATLAPEVESK